MGGAAGSEQGSGLGPTVGPRPTLVALANPSTVDAAAIVAAVHAVARGVALELGVHLCAKTTRERTARRARDSARGRPRRCTEEKPTLLTGLLGSTRQLEK